MKKPEKKQILFALIIVVVIGLSATAATLFVQYQASIAPIDQKDKQPIGSQKLPAEKKADDADKIAFEGDVSAGVKVLDDAIKETTDPHSKFIYYSRKATLLFDEKDFAGALAAAIQAYELEKSAGSAAFVGQIANDKGDKPLAIDYYKRAIGLVDPDAPLGKQDKEYYQGIITQLEGGAARG